MKIGILGGTFDPPHNGHLALAEAARTSLGLDEVILLPANRNPLKTRSVQTDGRKRLEMVRLAALNQPGLAVSDMELTRGGQSYTVDTLGELQMVAPAEYWFIVGSDSLKTLSEWRNLPRLARLCRLAVALRPPTLPAEIAPRIPADFADRYDLISMPLSDVSSTEIRERVARGNSIAAYVSPAVANYIRQNGLYK